MSESRTSEAAGERVELGYGEGGVPWPLLLFYLSFLVFFTWYVLEFQLPDFLQQGPGVSQEAPAEAGSTAPASDG